MCVSRIVKIANNKSETNLCCNVVNSNIVPLIVLFSYIMQSPKPPEYIFWYHNERMINYGNSREVVVRTEPGARTHSRLTIRDARISDTGNYTCKTAHAEPASIFVYVSQGKVVDEKRTSYSLLPFNVSQKKNKLLAYFISCIYLRN